MNIFKKNFNFGNNFDIEIETGKLAKQAHGSVVVKQGKTMILATVVSSYDVEPDLDWLPLMVDYQEKFAAVGRFPGGFLKREGRLSDYEILISRLVDRALRPLFPSDYHANTQVNISLISSDENILPDALVGFAASMAIMMSDIPFNGPVSEVRVGRIGQDFIVNPTVNQMEMSDVDMIIAGTADNIMMVEGEMNGISEQEMIQAIKMAHEVIKLQCQAQIHFAEYAQAKEIREYNHEINDEQLEKQVNDDLYKKLYDIAATPADKNSRAEAFENCLVEYVESFGEDLEEEKASLIKKYFKMAKKKAVRDMVLEKKLRLDGRSFDEIRSIYGEIDYLPAAHGSAVFTRGETQALASVTLGSKLDEQMLDSPMNQGTTNFILHYNFPAFSTGEVRPNRGPGRREIGHGNLALRGLKRMLPEDLNYTVRVVSDVLESNGSSSMATVCAGSMALMDAGIALKAGVSGIAMGMIADSETGKYAILSDILGDEDHLGDMDFKVVGNRDGIYACQMDIKVDGLKYEILEEALLQAKQGRMHILEKMEDTISKPKDDLKPHAPRITKIQIDKEFIGGIIGSGGKNIQELQANTNTTISIEEVGGFGIVEIMGNQKEGMQQAIDYVNAFCTTPEVGQTYIGPVKSILDFGAFVEFLPGKDGLLHISEISYERVENVSDVLKEGDTIEVKLIEIDQKSGKFRLSRKALLEKPEGYVEKPVNRNNDRNSRNDRNNRNQRSGGGRNNR